MNPDIESHEFIEYLEQFKSIALVGNSPKLLESHAGDAIDEHACVIRFNDGVVAGFERHVGSRTSIRLLGGRFARRHHDFFTSCDEQGLLVTKDRNKPLLEQAGLSKKFVFIHDYRGIERNAIEALGPLSGVQGHWSKPPRTGVVLLSMLCRHMEQGRPISLYGFDLQILSKAKQHYYEGRRMYRAVESWGDFHCPYEVEFEILGKLRDRGYVRIF